MAAILTKLYELTQYIERLAIAAERIAAAIEKKSGTTTP